MYENQNKHNVINVFSERNLNFFFRFLFVHVWEKVEEIQIGFPLGMLVLLWRHCKYL